MLLITDMRPVIVVRGRTQREQTKENDVRTPSSERYSRDIVNVSNTLFLGLI